MMGFKKLEYSGVTWPLKLSMLMIAVQTPDGYAQHKAQ